jgi:uncharacterized DUF497 family protein
MRRSVTWDEAKRQQLLREREIDIIRVARILENPEDLIINLDRRVTYGEFRYQAIGRLDSTFYFLVYTKRKGKRHLITAWRLDDEGRRRYQNRNPRRN